MPDGISAEIVPEVVVFELLFPISVGEAKLPDALLSSTI